MRNLTTQCSRLRSAGICLFALFLPVHTANAGLLDWWSTPEQKAARAFEKQQPGDLLSVAPNKEWSGLGQFQAGEYEQASDSFAKNAEQARESGDVQGLQRALYNQALSKTMAGNYQEALQHYEELLSENPAHADALQNREVTRRLQEQERQEQADQSGENGEGGEGEGGEQGQGGEQSEQQQNSEGEQSTDDPNSRQNGDDRGDDSKSGEQNANKQGDAESGNESGQQQGQDEESQQPGAQNGQPDESSSDDASSAELADADTEQAQREAEQARQALQAEAEADADADADSEMSDTGQDDSADQEQAGVATGSLDGEQQEIPLSEEQQAIEQLLRRIPDDPAGLLRRKLQQSHRSEYPEVRDGLESW